MRRPKRTPIPVDDRSSVQERLDRLRRAAERLAGRDVFRLDKVLTLAETYVAAYADGAQPSESELLACMSAGGSRRSN